MKIRFLILILPLIMLTLTLKARNAGRNSAPKNTKHEFRISYSDALPLTIANFIGTGVSGVISGMRRVDSESFGMLSAGYRYQIRQFRAGADIGYVSVCSLLKYSENGPVSYRQKERNFLIMPAGEFTYYRSRIVELYGTAGAGVLLSHSKFEDISAKKRERPADSNLQCDFAFQINPIAIRVGNNIICGFFELGLGYKGFCTLGISFRI